MIMQEARVTGIGEIPLYIKNIATSNRLPFIAVVIIDFEPFSPQIKRIRIIRITVKVIKIILIPFFIRHN